MFEGTAVTTRFFCLQYHPRPGFAFLHSMQTFYWTYGIPEPISEATISIRSIHNTVTNRIRELSEFEKKAQSLSLYLAGKTTEEIEAKINLGHGTFSKQIREYSENPNHLTEFLQILNSTSKDEETHQKDYNLSP